jgi:hypothetical protein
MFAWSLKSIVRINKCLAIDAKVHTRKRFNSQNTFIIESHYQPSLTFWFSLQAHMTVKIFTEMDTFYLNEKKIIRLSIKEV